MQFAFKHLYIIMLVLSLNWSVCCYDFTNHVFEHKSISLLAAFGDFNADKLTDVFVLTNNFKAFEVLLASEKPPYLQKSHLSYYFESNYIVSIVPGDFDGDASMDVLVVTSQFMGQDSPYKLYICWGSLERIECPSSEKELLTVLDQPLVLDYNSDMISDIFGLGTDQKRAFWIMNTNRTIESKIIMEDGNGTLRAPHSHGFLDLDGDMASDLLLTGSKYFEFWQYNNSGFQWNKTIELPVKEASIMGQSTFSDFNSDGTMDHLVPVCVDRNCRNSTFYVYTSDKWYPVECNLIDNSNNLWTFYPPDSKQPYLEAITARSGDFNLDGYPDLLITLRNSNSYSDYKAVLLENAPCNGCPFSRQFVPKWNLLNAWNNTLMGTFYDIQENGILDILLVHKVNGSYELAAFKNALDYDANFIKVIVLTGRCYRNCHHGQIPYGTNLPGPFISYRTIKSNGDLQIACHSQLSQSAYHSLQLPYTLFGLGHTPNFLESLHVGLAYHDPERRIREWTQIIPNSQMVIIPNLEGQPRYWINKLFVTPSRVIVLSAAALAGFGLFLAVIIIILHCRERKADKLEKLAQSYRFHFDAM
nr:EOG090X03KG [Cyclestheria hislopi]